MSHHDLPQSNLFLGKGQLLRLENACGTRVQCRSGTLWITIDNDRRDVVLEAGESFVLDSQASTLVQAIMGMAELQATRPADAPPCPQPTPGLAGWWLGSRKVSWARAGAV